MKNEINIKINDFGPINEANISLNKINIVGGNNATGKSTTSKLLYCFLKSYIENRIDFALNHYKRHINFYINHIYQILNVNKPDFVYMKDINIFEGNDKVIPYDELSVEEKFNHIQKEYHRYATNNNSEEIANWIKKIDDILTTIHLEEDDLTIFLLKDLLSTEFINKNLKFNSSFNGIVNGDKFNIEINLKDNDFDSDNAFSAKGIFNSGDVFYIDSFSFFETHAPWTTNYHHVGYITEILMLDNQKEIEDITDERLLKVISKIKEIINGEITFVENKFTFVQDETNNEDNLFIISEAASGIKQIAIIQLLLSNQKLKPNSFLIFDEPEVNLHPEWQFKFAEILVLLAKELDITIYINSHSPMFIEAMEVLTQYYDLDEDTNFYLTKKFENNKYNFVKIDYDNLYELYDNLSKPFDAIEVYRLKNEYKKGNYE